MWLRRLFFTESLKGTRNYLDTQKKYEIIRTLIYFAVSLSLFAAGYIQTKTKVNLLTIVAVLGCLPASKSAISVIMFLRFRSFGGQAAEEAARKGEGLSCLFDMVFTSYKKNYIIGHLAVRGSTVCGFSEDGKFEENDFYKHIGDLLKLDGHQNVTVKIFTDQAKYMERLGQMKLLEAEEAKTQAIIATLKSGAL